MNRPDVAAMTERELQHHVAILCRDLGLWHYHTWNSQRSEPGWPDCVILGGATALFRELKSERGRLTPEQRRCGSLLTRAGLDWCVWRPRDLADGTIARQLAAITACAVSPRSAESPGGRPRAASHGRIPP